ncbi:WXG100-like domain-containing protein [Gandjariella thermophila]|uniref:Outer membrane channel protein CpnT-like N-terminal domain-containing protein n=1 Tax=Gandjariella thermophila TaxID=1931992 RepID=A0A4D4J9R5_9PSEU|nr:hypothetical protein [Gandjariella thermophila]GDY32304.1 hypothetical protein GTS_39370 [Gandjariella thermophila]
MAGDNPLVDPKSRFNPKEYEFGINPVELSKGDYSALNPVTSGPGGNWYSGTGIIDDFLQYKKDIESGNGWASSFDMVAVGLDTLGLIQDPLGSALSMLAGWMIDHLKPLKLMLDELAGNPDTVTGVANTWKNISRQLTTTGTNYRESVSRDIAGWHGPAADAYHRRASVLVEALASAAALADAMSALVTIGAELVSTVRGTIRDIIANLVGELASDALQEACTLGAATPVVAEEATGAIERETAVAAKLVKSLVKVLTDGLFIASKLNTLFSEIVKVLPSLQRIGKDVQAGPAVAQ